MLELFLSSLTGLFVIVDPLGTSAVFIALMGTASAEQKLKTALKATLIATALLTLFGFFGHFLLESLGISLDAFRIAGGLLLFTTAFRMIMGETSSDTSSAVIDTKSGRFEDLAIFPLAIPLLAGPGCMTTTVLLMSNATAFSGKIIVLIALIIVEAIAFLTMVGSAHVSKLVGKTGNSLISKLMGVLLAALAVQFIADGVLNILHSPQ